MPQKEAVLRLELGDGWHMVTDGDKEDVFKELAAVVHPPADAWTYQRMFSGSPVIKLGPENDAAPIRMTEDGRIQFLDPEERYVRYELHATEAQYLSNLLMDFADEYMETAFTSQS